MNKFKQLVNKLIKVKLWSSECTVIQLDKIKDEKGRLIESQKKRKIVNCVTKDITRKLQNDNFQKITSFYFAAINLQQFDLSKKFQIIYNYKTYNVVDVLLIGTLANQHSVVKMDVIR